MVIYKYELQITDEQTVEMPRGARLLSVQMQRERLMLWAVVNTNEPIRSRVIRIHGTGIAISPEHNYAFIGTVQDGPFVWHVFDGGQRR